MAKATKKTKSDGDSKEKMSKEKIQEYIQDIAQKSSMPEESRLHCAIAINQILSNPDYIDLMSDESKGTLKEVWHKLKSEGIQLEDPPFLFGLPENFEQEELAN